MSTRTLHLTQHLTLKNMIFNNGVCESPPARVALQVGSTSLCLLRGKGVASTSKLLFFALQALSVTPQQTQQGGPKTWLVLLGGQGRFGFPPSTAITPP